MRLRRSVQPVRRVVEKGAIPSALSSTELSRLIQVRLESPFDPALVLVTLGARGRSASIMVGEVFASRVWAVPFLAEATQPGAWGPRLHGRIRTTSGGGSELTWRIVGSGAKYLFRAFLAFFVALCALNGLTVGIVVGAAVWLAGEVAWLVHSRRYATGERALLSRWLADVEHALGQPDAS
jgi:hypothetical protein